MKINLKNLEKKTLLKKGAKTLLLFAAAFLAGTAAGKVQDHFSPDAAETITSADTIPEGSAASAEIATSADGNWGLSFQQEGQPPVANATSEELKKYDAYYTGNADEKVIYLTFDAGFENGNMPAILDALKKHNVSATFFVVGTFISTNPDLVKRMTAEGHTVGNHTYHHPDMSQISTKEAFQKELGDVEAAYKEATGEEMTKFYRPPQGKYSESNLQMAKDLGYKTFFWSLAYVDWYENDQPTKEEAFEKLLGRIHPGAIVLLHSTSKTNGEILDELLTKWEEMGYTFKTLQEL
ncbi:delta-lactam-biosynthetic de-N-acetylase [Faecalicatena orotica]|uniref:Peptidoglycan-N-acetylmuramic acid deacetylase n=1 Tax=Faecalicatena orotica TaxID=1544 RepID=A0A2Y9BFE6_9FIRM|nr:delta-lactam-biosynthetic de-N-acetylase [Faecalicatena orotica]PWJ29059.1 peptidoglycan-N-acetylmuramic acid deacetylase [Faecalicatena orotica]SSA56229.1 peptidoglycan-N-acetylmuramic acid deacetylase [Faecalicatena orotica]